jgi:hypothetical protein
MHLSKHSISYHRVISQNIGRPVEVGSSQFASMTISYKKG